MNTHKNNIKIGYILNILYVYTNNNILINL